MSDAPRPDDFSDPKPNLFEVITSYEQDDLQSWEVIELFARLLNTGMIFELQGSYVRQAERFIESGAITQDHQTGEWTA